MELSSAEFGEVALQLLAASNIPGAQLDVALAFKQMAEKLRDSELIVTTVNEQE